MSVYIDRYTTHGKCRFCGKQGPERVKDKPKYFKAQYGWIFRKCGWFRGDDEFLGKCCVDCRKLGKLKTLLAV